VSAPEAFAARRARWRGGSAAFGILLGIANSTASSKFVNQLAAAFIAFRGRREKLRRASLSRHFERAGLGAAFRRKHAAGEARSFVG
jgi:hypothetical protein